MKGNWFKIVVLVVLSFLIYLFALNDRYYISGKHGVVIDKWNKEIISWSELK